MWVCQYLIQKFLSFIIDSSDLYTIVSLILGIFTARLKYKLNTKIFLLYHEGDQMSNELKTSYNENRRLPSTDISRTPSVAAARSIRTRETVRRREKKDCGRGSLFLKQCIAAAIIIFACVMINRSGFNFGKNCISALGRAVHWQFDFGAAWSSFTDWFGGITEFWRDAF